MDALQEAALEGIIDIDEIQRMVELTKTEKMLKKHPYKLTQLKDGRWQTYIQLPKGGRKCLKHRTKDGLIKRLYNWYYKEINDEHYLIDIFEEWLVYKTSITESLNTIKRHRQHFNKYLRDTPIFQRRISSLKPLEMNAFANELVKKYNLTKNEWTNVNTILKGMFNYSLDQGYITTNPLDRVRITVRYRQVDKRVDGSRVFNSKEVEELKEYLEKKFSETADLAYLAVLVNFYLGLRVGELAALKWGDIINDRLLHISREEARDQVNNDYFVAEHTKGYRVRDVIIVPQALKIFKRVREMYPFAKDDDYIFVRDGERVNARQITYVYEKYAKVTGHKTKRSHTSRRTYASNLQASGVPIDEIRKQLGHRDISTTLGYIYNPFTEQVTYDTIVAAFESDANSKPENP